MHRCPLRSRKRAHLEPAAGGELEALPDPDQAWKILALVNDWIRHSDAKAAVTLAFTGVMGTMIFNLIRDFENRSLEFDALAVLACALLVLTGGLCGWTLTPRTSTEDGNRAAANRLFYISIAKRFNGKREEYARALKALTANPVELTRDISDQIHANAEIATKKAAYATWAIRSALAAGATIAALAIFIGASNTQG